MSFEPVDHELDLVMLETRIGRRWREDDVFAESLRRREGAPEWVFYEGPPTANGRPGLHHAWARSFKDLFPRFHTMRGSYVARKGGWDCHGLPVELEVEKELGFSGKREIEEYGIAAFNERCRASVHRYVEDWSALTSRLGMWLDTEHAYWTLTNGYVESIWWHLRQLWDHELIYEGFKVVPYCGRCGTALSSHEVAQGYEDVTEPSVYVRFPAVAPDGTDGDFDLLVWTTTPWTLVSNVGAAIGPDIDYVRVRGRDGRRDLVLARARVTAVLGEEAEIVADVPVADLVGLHYRRPLDLLDVGTAVTPWDLQGEPFRVVADPFVTVDDGSGIVHLAPAFGDVDREVSEREGLPVLNPVNAEARFGPEVAPFAGRFVKDADAEIIELLGAAGLLEQVLDYTHSYPHCWRCGTPLIYWAKPTWFAPTTARRDELLAQNEIIDWHPAHIKHGRFGDWLATNVDWALSRDRFWGTPLPIWRCDDCGHETCVGSVAELSERAGRDLSELDLHRPAVDEIELDCPSCNRPSRRVEPVLDAWFDSGAMPASQLHYPFEGVDTFERRFPADFICEAIDQTRGWFYSLLAVNTLVFGRSPYRHVVCLGHIVDRDGQKMSKSRGNVIDPWSILETRGADALRWFFFSSGAPWSSRRVDDSMIESSTRTFLLTLWNVYSFFVTYANLDGWGPGSATGPTPSGARPRRHVLDRWIRSRLHSTVREVTEALEAYDAYRGAQALERLVDDLSNWYVRRSRARFWKAADPQAYETLHECLTTIALLLAPFCPFVADECFANLTGSTESVHLQDWPAADVEAIDATLEDDVARTRDLVGLGRAARNDAGLKTRQPLARALVLLPDGVTLSEELVAEVAEELNVKRIEAFRDLGGLLDERASANFRRLGPRVGKAMPRVKAAIEQLDVEALRAAFADGGTYALMVDGESVALDPDDVEIHASAHEEFALAREGAYAVALDTALDDDLRREGLARELVRAINDHRKASGLELSDRIAVGLYASGELALAAQEHGPWIAGEVLATDWTVHVDGEPSGAVVLTVGGDSVAVSVRTV